MSPDRWKQIEDLYHATSDHDAAVLPAFLDKECAGDQELRREVESLLRASRMDAGLFETSLVAAAAPMFVRPKETLSVGTRLGPYEIQSPIASGGMGEVYSAHDTRLGRTVAIKILPPHVADSSDLRERFEREARTISSLNHPHICTLYDIGHQDGINFIVMEYLEGKTLAERLLKGRMPLREALHIALQIGDALDKAHRSGVVHRDLKPPNIVLTKTVAKLVDFGVAARQDAESKRGETVTLAGTFEYMAPEQLEGSEGDARTDIFAFGAVLYEMLTGTKAFAGRADSGSGRSSLDPDPVRASGLSDQPLLQHLVAICMSNDPDKRWQTMADVLIQLTLIADFGIALVPLTVAARFKRRLRLISIAMAILLATSLAFIVSSFQQEKAFTATISAEIPTPAAPSTLDVALSPTSTHVAAIVSTESRENVLWIRALEHLNPQVFAGTSGAGLPFWSPDGQSIGFFADGKLKITGLTAAPPQEITDAAAGRGGTWNANDVIVFAPAGTGPLYRVSAGGGIAAKVTGLDSKREERAHRHPQFLPDGEHFLYLALSHRAENSAIYIGSLNSPERKFLVNSPMKAIFAPPDRLLYVRSGTLVSQRFDLQRLELNEEPVPIVQDIGTNVVTNNADFSVSDNGTLAYRTGGSGGNTYLRWFDRLGNEIGKVATLASYESPVLSPDLQRLAVARIDGSTSNIWILDLLRGPLTRFTFGARADVAPLWSPDGTRIVYASNRDGAALDLYQQSSSGLGEVELLLKSDHPKVPEDWSPDGRLLLFRDDDPERQADLWILPLGGERKPFPAVRTAFRDIHGRFSPDGKRLAYVSNESGRNEVYVQGFPAAGRKLQISTSGGFQPRWGRGGKELLFISGAASHTAVVMSVDIGVSPDGSLTASVPRKLFAVNPVSAVAHRNTWDVTPDAERFIVNSAQQTASSSIPITVVVNWRKGKNGNPL